MEKNVDMEQLKINVKQINDITLISLTGYIDTYNSNGFLKTIEKLISEEDCIKIVIDFKNISYLSSTGIGAMAQILKIVRSKGGNIILCQVDHKVYDVFTLLGFTSFFTFEDSVEKGLKSFNGKKEIPIFPATIKCPVCNRNLRAIKAGRFRCPSCKSIITVNSDASVKF